MSSTLEINQAAQATTDKFTHLLGVFVCLIPLFSVNYTPIFYYSCVLLIFISLGYLIAKRPQHNLTTSEKWVIAAFIAYPTWAAADMLIRDNWVWNEFKEPSRFLLIIPVFLTLRLKKIPLEYLYLGLFGGAIWAGSTGLYQSYVEGVYRANGDASHVTAFGNISLMLGALSITAIKGLPHWPKRLFVPLALLAFVVGLLGSMTSGSKGGWISLPLLFWIIVDLSSNATYKKRFIALGIMATIATTAYFMSHLVSSRVDAVVPSMITFFTTGQLTDGSVSYRLEMWKASLTIFQQNPLIGTGLGTYFAEKSHLIQEGLIDPKTLHFVQSHNQLLQALAEGGILAALLIYGIYGTAIKRLRELYDTNRPMTVAGIMLCIGFMDFGMADGIWTITNAGTFFALMLVILLGAAKQKLNS